MLSTAAHKANHSGLVFQDADESPGDALFCQALRLFFLGADLHDRSAIVLYAGLTRHLGTLIRIDVFDMDFWRDISVLVKQILRFVVPGALFEIANSCVLVQPSD